jgi:phage terminase large subunit-like protein
MSSQISNFVDVALQYCDDVLSGKILAGKQVHQAIQRHYDDLDKIGTPGFRYTFSVEKAERVCKFASRLCHTKGKWAGKKNSRLKLEPWQVFFLTTLFGWIDAETRHRRFREALLSVPRKNGKSLLASAIGLYCLLCDNEPGAEIFAAANNLDQALEVFRPASVIVNRLTTLREHFEIEANVKSLVIPDGSRFVPLVGIPHDGSSPSCCLLDEYHEASDDGLYLSLNQGMGARDQALMLITTTSGTTIEGPCHKLQKECEEMLEGIVDRPELFALIYTINKETDWTTDEALVMANPNMGVSVGIDYLRTAQRNAIKSAAKQNPFKTKHLNIWCNAATAFFNMAQWAECADEKLKPEMFEGKQCWMGADFAPRLDLTCVVKVFKDGGTYYVFPKLYLPEERAQDPTLGMYSKWTAEGALIATDGNVVDFDRIMDDVAVDIEKYKPIEFAFDQYSAEMVTQTLKKRFPSKPTFVEIPQETKYLSPAMFELEAWMTSKRIKHPNNPVANWCMSNVSAKADHRGNVYPRKDGGRAENKIDFVSALLDAISRITHGPEKRGTSKIFFG